ASSDRTGSPAVPGEIVPPDPGRGGRLVSARGTEVDGRLPGTHRGGPAGPPGPRGPAGTAIPAPARGAVRATAAARSGCSPATARCSTPTGPGSGSSWTGRRAYPGPQPPTRRSEWADVRHREGEGAVGGAGGGAAVLT